tara:strand:- start:6049 stop:6714 length:666 start_codon:yes stop_codon:yes gene_type:complete
MVDLAFVTAQTGAFFSRIIFATGLVLAYEIMRTILFFRESKTSEKIEEHMTEEGVSEEQAEAETKEEKDVEKAEKKTWKLATKEFAELKELYDEVKDAAAGREFLDKAGKKLRSMKKEEKIEKKLSNRILSLSKEADDLAKVEPTKKKEIKNAVAKIVSSNNKLIGLMGENQAFEKVINRRVGPGFDKEQKKEELLKILKKSMLHEISVMRGLKNLAKIAK